jgi:hypothetical protein
MRGSGHTPTRGSELLLAHVQALGLPPHRQRSPESRLNEQVGPVLTGLLLCALTGERGVPHSVARV